VASRHVAAVTDHLAPVTRDIMECSMNDTTNEERFEDQLARLEEIVARLEDEGVGLEESLDLFESGMALVKSCRERLEKVEQRVARLLESENGEAITEDLELEGS
jgi:exodeoxyribonuclease VII small subunit